MKMKLPWLTFIILWLGHSATAQQFIIKRIEQTPESIMIHYDLINTPRIQPYLVQVFSSRDNFLNPLTHVSGDVGIDVQPGINHKITWNVKEELGDAFKGDIQLEIKGKVYVPFISVSAIGKKGIVKRAGGTEITWSGDTNKNILTFSLFRNSEMVTVIPNIPNIGKSKIPLPLKIEPGGGYYFVITETGDPEHIVKTEEFMVKKRYSTIVKIAPVAIVAAVVVLLIPEKEPDVVTTPFGPPTGKN